MHYADDAIITIKQNKCFKEVIKDLSAFQRASGAKVNYEKTKGLWGGAWEKRTDTPLNTLFFVIRTRKFGLSLKMFLFCSYFIFFFFFPY